MQRAGKNFEKWDVEENFDFMEEWNWLGIWAPETFRGVEDKC